MNKGSTPIGIKLNNPLNIEYNPANNWNGQINPGSHRFAHFSDKKYGYRAAFKLLNNYVTRYGANTIDKIIDRWAPPEDHNDTENYIQFVAKQTGIKRHTPVTPDQYMDIIAAMARMETADNDVASLTAGHALAFA